MLGEAMCAIACGLKNVRRLPLWLDPPPSKASRMTTRAAIVAETRAWIGTPYRHQASLKSVGCDCLGLLRGVFRALVGPEPEPVPPYAPDWAEATNSETFATAAARHLVPIKITAAAAGDVLLFRWRDGHPAKHCAIATDPDRMVHAHDGACVAEIAVRPWWRRHLGHAFRFPAAGAG